jgi:hypothetical protein
MQLTRGLWSSSSCKVSRDDNVVIGSAIVFCTRDD